MNYDMLIFANMGQLVDSTVVYFCLIIILDAVRSMMFSDR